MFPQGRPGVALLLLRISLAATLLVSLAKRPDVSSAPLLFAAILVVCLVSVSLSVGFLTPLLSIIAGVAVIANLLIDFNLGNFICLFSIVNAAALALLGPGAYSVDARLFGRRVIVIHSHKDTRKTQAGPNLP
jgi:hypothetical protein